MSFNFMVAVIIGSDFGAQEMQAGIMLVFDRKRRKGIPGGPVVKNVPCNARDTSLITGGPGRSYMPQSN